MTRNTTAKLATKDFVGGNAELWSRGRGSTMSQAAASGLSDMTIIARERTGGLWRRGELSEIVA